jgi:ketol-acid reductoisomerase
VDVRVGLHEGSKSRGKAEERGLRVPDSRHWSRPVTRAANWIAEYDAGLPNYREHQKADENHPLETTGREVRKLMSWVAKQGG